MPSRLKELLAQGKLVRVFGLGQLCHPKLVEIIALTRRLRRRLARPGARRPDAWSRSSRRPWRREPVGWTVSCG